jgi:hypothetical protein
MISNINYGVYRGKRTVSLCLCTHLSVLWRRQLDLCMRFSCEYSGNCTRFSIFAQQNIDSVVPMTRASTARAAASALPRL